MVEQKTCNGLVWFLVHLKDLKIYITHLPQAGLWMRSLSGADLSDGGQACHSHVILQPHI